MKLRNLAPGAQQLVAMGALPWFGGIALAALLAGVSLGAVAGYKWNVARALRAELALSKLERSIDSARAGLHADAAFISGQILEGRDVQKKRIESVAAAVDDLGRRVQLCATKSDVRVTVTPAGTIEAVPGGQLRDLAESVREFAQACARQRDTDATDHNALIDWLEKMAKRGQ